MRDMDREICDFNQKWAMGRLARDILQLFSTGVLLVEQCNECCGSCVYETEDDNTVPCPECHGTGYRVKEGYGTPTDKVCTTKCKEMSNMQLQEDLHE